MSRSLKLSSLGHLRYQCSRVCVASLQSDTVDLWRSRKDVCGQLGGVQFGLRFAGCSEITRPGESAYTSPAGYPKKYSRVNKYIPSDIRLWLPLAKWPGQMHRVIIQILNFAENLEKHYFEFTL